MKKQHLAEQRILKANKTRQTAQQVYDTWKNNQIVNEETDELGLQTWLSFKAEGIRCAYKMFVLPRLTSGNERLSKKIDIIPKLEEVFRTNPNNLDVAIDEPEQTEEERDATQDMEIPLP